MQSATHITEIIICQFHWRTPRHHRTCLTLHLQAPVPGSHTSGSVPSLLQWQGTHSGNWWKPGAHLSHRCPVILGLHLYRDKGNKTQHHCSMHNSKRPPCLVIGQSLQQTNSTDTVSECGCWHPQKGICYDLEKTTSVRSALQARLAHSLIVLKLHLGQSRCEVEVHLEAHRQSS